MGLILKALLAVAIAAAGTVGLPLRPAAGEVAAARAWAPAAAPDGNVQAAVQLTTGKVLAAIKSAGCNPAPPGTSVCFGLYDPVTDAWAPTPPLPGPGGIFAQVVALRDGQALAVLTVVDTPNPAYGYLYRDGLWRPIPPLDRTRGFTLTAIEGTREQCGDHCGKALLAFGVKSAPRTVENQLEVQRSGDLYDPVSNTLTRTGLTSRRYVDTNYSTGALLADGRVLVNSQTEGVSEIFNPGEGERGTWTAGPDRPKGGVNGPPSAVLMPDGQVLVAGSAELPPLLFDPRTPVWRKAAPCPDVDRCGALAVLPEGQVLSVGEGGRHGGGGRVTLNAAAVFDPGGVTVDRDTGESLVGSWRAVDPPNMSARTAVLLKGGAAQCGAQCGSVLALGGTITPTRDRLFPETYVGEAARFGLLTVGGLSPLEGLACGGKEVTITGRGLARATAVSFGDQVVEDVVATDSTVTVRAPRHVAGPSAVPVTVRFADGGSVRVPGGFTFTSPGPATLTSLSEREGSAAGGTAVQITGQFPAECVRSVTFGLGDERRVVPQGPVNDTRVTVSSPRGTPGELVRVVVEIDPGPPGSLLVPSVPSGPAAADFTYRSLPVIAGINPAGVSALGGTARLSGTGFERYPQDAAGPRVTVGDQPAGVTGGDATGLTVTVPPLGQGREVGGGVPVVVTTDGRGQSAPFTSFAYHPGVRQIAPSFGRRDERTPVTLTGRGLGQVSEVRLGGVPATITARSDTQLTVVTAPRAVAETVPVQVVALGLVSLEQVLFRFDGPPPRELTDRGGGNPILTDQGGGPTGEQPSLPGGGGGTGTAPVQAQALGQAQAPVQAPAPIPVSAPAPGQAFGQAPGLGQALAPGQAPGQAPVVAQAPGIAAPGAPVAPAVPAAAAAQGSTGGGGGPGSGQGAGAREQDDDSPAERPSTRYAMNRASSDAGPVGLGAALMTGCFSLLMLRRRAGAGRNPERARPRGAY